MKKDKQIQDLMDFYGEWFNDGKTLEQGKMTQNLYPYESIFSPIKVGKLTIKNRLVMAPMGNISMCDETGRPNEKMIAYFTERAKGGVGQGQIILGLAGHFTDNFDLATPLTVQAQGFLCVIHIFNLL